MELEMPSSESNVIQKMLAKSVVRIKEESEKRKLKEVMDERLNKVKTPLSNRPVDVPKNGLEVALVYNHLKEVSPRLAGEFAASHFIHRTDIKLLEVVSISNRVCQALKEKPIEIKTLNEHVEQLGDGQILKDRLKSVKFQQDNLTLSLVYNHLKDVSPHLAEEFAASRSFHRTDLKLEEVVITYKQTSGSYKKDMSTAGNDNMKIEKLQSKDGEMKNRKRPAKCKLNMQKRSTYTFYTVQEDELIKAAMEEADEDIDYVALAKKMTRTQMSVRGRVQTLKRTGGIRKSKAYTLVEDQIIMENLIFPRLVNEKLSEIVLCKQQYLELTKQLGKSPQGVLQRWQNVLQPWLLQHFSGTLNLRIERMLANYLAETFSEISEINWTKVASRKEFAGHTEFSLNSVFSKLLFMYTRDGVVDRADVGLQGIAQLCEEVYGRGEVRMIKKKLDRQREVIAFFERKVAELGIKDFV